MATLEMGLIEIEQNNHDEAKKWLDHAEKDFAGYTAENFVHLKVYAAIRMMGYKTDKEMANKEKCKLSTKMKLVVPVKFRFFLFFNVDLFSMLQFFF